MRTVAFASLIAAAGLAGAAYAQTPPATTTVPAAPTPAPGAAMTSPAGPAAAPAPTQAPAAPPSVQPPAAGGVATPAPAPAAPAAPAPTLPTSGDGAVVLSVLEKVCVPAVRGGNFDQVAASAGMKKNRRDGSYTLGLGGDRNYVITVFAPGSNKDVCQAEIHYAIGQDKPIVSAINVWSFLHQPELVLQANYVNVDPDGIKRVRKSWEHLESNSSTAVNFSTLSKPDGTPLNGRYDTAAMFYQERKF